MSEEIKQDGAIIQIANGQINNKIAKDKLRPGELFWLTKHTDGPTNDYVWSDGELIMGCPEGISDNSYTVVGGTRSGRAVVYRGLITYESEITDSLFKHARVGDFWRFDRDATEGTFKYYNFHQNDFLMVTSAEVDPKTGLSSQITFFRINNSFSETNATTLIFSDPAFEATTVYDAIMSLYETKWQWGGTLSSSEQIISELAEGTIHEGTVWYELVDDLVFIEPHGTGSLIGKRGDLWLYRGEENGWVKVITGYTDAEDIDYNADFISEMMSSFSDEHKEDISKLETVKDAIDFILQHKAEIGSDGKIKTSQLPDVVFNGMKCGGTWNPLISEEGISGTDLNAQKAWPSTTNDGEEIARGTYFIVNIDNLTQNQDSTRVNVQYWDKTQVDINNNNTRCLELNTGDWVIYTGYQWEKIDNTDRLAGLVFITNSKQGKNDLAENTTEEITVTGMPRIRSDNKIGIRQEDTDIIIGGIRLINQTVYEESKGNFIPKYSDEEHNSVTNSAIEDTATVTILHQNTQVGDINTSANTTHYGNIILQATEDSREITYNFENNKTTIRAITPSHDNVLLLPNKSGTLATTKDLLVGDGTEGYLPVFTIKLDENNEEILALMDSSTHYQDSAIYDQFETNIHSDTFEDTDLFKISFNDILATYYNTDTRTQNIVIESDVLIGGTANHSLHITQNLSFGNKNTGNTIISSGREIYPDSYAYKKYIQTTKKDDNNFDVPVWAIEDKPNGNVYIGLPADSGALLTTNSPIHGGVYLETETVEDYEESVLFRVTDDWENTLGISTHTATGKDIAYIYKPDQSLNKADEVTFASITAADIIVNTIKADSNNVLDIISKETIHVYLNNTKTAKGIISADLQGNADTASEAAKLKNSLTINATTEWGTQDSSYFDGSKPVNQKFYTPDQNVNIGADVNFGTTVMKDLFVNFDPKHPDTDFDFRRFKNHTNITDAWLENMGIENSRQVSII